MAGVIVDTGDAGAFLARLLRLDAAAVVRLRPSAGADPVAIWARLPFGVLVTRRLRVAVSRDVTVRADALLAVVDADGTELPAAVDSAWRWPLPGGPGAAVEALPPEEVRRVALAAADAVREALGGRAVGSRRIRDAMLDHVPIVIDTGTERVRVSQRLVQGVTRMGFLGTDRVIVRRSGGWIGLAATHGTCWHHATGGSLAVQPAPLPA